MLHSNPTSSSPSGRRRARCRHLAVATLSALTALAAVVATAPAALAATPPPPTDPFYTPPAGFELTKPGTVLRSRPVTLEYLFGADSAASYQLLYRTTGPIGQPLANVATVMIPKSPAPGPRRLLSYQTFYNSLTLSCAPSYTMQGGNYGFGSPFTEMAEMVQGLQQGWDVVVPDFEGPQSEWAVGPMTGYATLDGIRAAENFDAALTGLNGLATPAAMIGYSGGAIASTWAEGLAPNYAPELKVVGVAAGGILPDMAYDWARLDGSDLYGAQIGVMVAINRAYPALNLDAILNANGKTLAASDAQDAMGCNTAAINTPFGSASQYTVYPTSQAMMAEPRIAAVFANLNLGAMASVPTYPSFYYNALNDEIALIQPVDSLVDKYCRAGATIDYYRDPNSADHIAGIPVFWSMAMPYLQDRFNGVAAPTTCSSAANSAGGSSSSGSGSGSAGASSAAGASNAAAGGALPFSSGPEPAMKNRVLAVAALAGALPPAIAAVAVLLWLGRRRRRHQAADVR